MTVHWLRVLLGGFVIELILAVVLIGGFAAAGVSLEANISVLSSTIIGVGCFAAAYLVVLWLGRTLPSGFAVHGLLMGIVATAIYLGLVAGSGGMGQAQDAYGPVTFVVINGLRILGALLAGAHLERSHASS